jgi:hypothetical protein
MAAIINNIATKGVNTAAATSWVKPLVDSAKAQTAGLGDAQPVVNAVLDTLVDNQDDLIQITAQGFVAIVSHLALKQPDQARLIFLATAATFEERMAVLDSDDAAAAKAKADSDARWAKIETIALDLLEAAGKAAIPLLLAAL